MIGTRPSLALLLLAITLTVVAALMVAIAVTYQLLHFDRRLADLPTWVATFPPVASFLAVIALVLHALSARQRREFQRRLQAVYGASGVAVALSDLPTWLRWLWPRRQHQVARAWGIGQATSALGRVVTIGLTTVVLCTSVGVSVAAPQHFFCSACGSAGSTGLVAKLNHPLILNGGYGEAITLPDGWKFTLQNFHQATPDDAANGQLNADPQMKVLYIGFTVVNSTSKPGYFEYFIEMKDKYGAPGQLPLFFIPAHPENTFFFIFYPPDPSSPYSHTFDPGQSRDGVTYLEGNEAVNDFTIILDAGIGRGELVEWNVSL